MSNSSAGIHWIHLISSSHPADHQQCGPLHTEAKLDKTGGAEEEKEAEEGEESEGCCHGKGKQLSHVVLWHTHTHTHTGELLKTWAHARFFSLKTSRSEARDRLTCSDRQRCTAGLMHVMSSVHWLKEEYLWVEDIPYMSKLCLCSPNDPKTDLVLQILERAGWKKSQTKQPVHVKFNKTTL